MKDLTFVHTADCHLDTPFAGISREDPRLAERLRETQRAAFGDLIDLCIERKAAFLVIAGDLYDARERSLTTRVRLREAFGRLREAGIEVFLATGNHDNLAETERGLAFPSNVHIFPPDRPETLLWPEERARVAITGMSYGRRDLRENLAARFPPPADDLFNIAVLHCNVDGDPNHDNYAPCGREELMRRGYHYWALGHIHERKVLGQSPATLVYPGCIQGRQMREAGEKGAMVVRVDGQGRVEPQFVALHRVQWVVAEAGVGESDSEEELAERLRARTAELAGQAPLRLEGLVVRWQLVGTLAVDAVAVRNALEMLRGEAFERRLFVWPESIDLGRAAPPLDFEELVREESPRGDLARLVEEIRRSPDEVKRLRAHLLEQVGPAELARELPAETPIEDLLEEALRLGVQRLSSRR